MAAERLRLRGCIALSTSTAVHDAEAEPVLEDFDEVGRVESDRAGGTHAWTMDWWQCMLLCWREWARGTEGV